MTAYPGHTQGCNCLCCNRPVLTWTKIFLVAAEAAHAAADRCQTIDEALWKLRLAEHYEELAEIASVFGEEAPEAIVLLQTDESL